MQLTTMSLAGARLVRFSYIQPIRTSFLSVPLPALVVLGQPCPQAYQPADYSARPTLCPRRRPSQNSVSPLLERLKIATSSIWRWNPEIQTASEHRLWELQRRLQTMADCSSQPTRWLARQHLARRSILRALLRLQPELNWPSTRAAARSLSMQHRRSARVPCIARPTGAKRGR